MNENTRLENGKLIEPLVICTSSQLPSPNMIWRRPLQRHSHVECRYWPLPINPVRRWATTPKTRWRLRWNVRCSFLEFLAPSIFSHQRRSVRNGLIAAATKRRNDETPPPFSRTTVSRPVWDNRGILWSLLPPERQNSSVLDLRIRDSLGLSCRLDSSLPVRKLVPAPLAIKLAAQSSILTLGEPSDRRKVSELAASTSFRPYTVEFVCGMGQGIGPCLFSTA